LLTLPKTSTQKKRGDTLTQAIMSLICNICDDSRLTPHRSICTMGALNKEDENEKIISSTILLRSADEWPYRSNSGKL
jgi:hypothetical protein